MNEVDFSDALSKIYARQARGLKIRIAFFVVYDSVFPSKNVMHMLADDPLFDVKVILIPDILRGSDNMTSQLQKSLASFSIFSSPVLSGYDFDKNSFIDFSMDFDIVVMSNPYEEMTHEYFRLSYLIKRSVLPIYIHYGFSIFKYDYKVLAQKHMMDFWRIFLDTSDCLDEMRKFSNFNWDNCRTTGYCKMDDLSAGSVQNKDRKCVIIAPHHTIENNNHLNLGSFLEYFDYYINLPFRYPSIDFIFRPHPMLMGKLLSGTYAPKELISSILERFLHHPNVEHSTESDYFPIFERSDAMIHDCASFTAEYLFTGKPVCFAKSVRTNLDETLGGVGKKCMQQHYIATSSLDIDFFLNHIVIGGEDPLKSEREGFAEAQLLPCGGNVSRSVINIIKDELSLSH